MTPCAGPFNAEKQFRDNSSTNGRKLFNLAGQDYGSPKAPGGTQRTQQHRGTFRRDNQCRTSNFIAIKNGQRDNNVGTAENRDLAQKLWLSIKECFASLQSLNRACIFNDFLYVKFQEDAVETFVTDIKVAIKKLVDVGIDLPQDILAYLVLFKLLSSMQTLKHQIMHSDKKLDGKEASR
ncbi:hypothetical protein VP01_337g5 [Puccinia sorghi]|uniref:Uncharacterized protein n=1 Tax=Puccinia sorghi TaxID=27349 RepID=A0A0L6UWS7_9BASI|nr:hypothetical protein VP01_337g5 [Puccinia sorghi]